jgi:uncharacterized protein with PIN domain
MIGRLICLVKRKHLRGKVVRVHPQSDGRFKRVTACPRCGRELSRIVATAPRVGAEA